MARRHLVTARENIRSVMYGECDGICTTDGRGKHSRRSAQSTATQNLSDRAFAKSAAEGGAEVALGTHAERKRNPTVVRNFAKQMVTEHTDAGEKLQSAASTGNIGITQKMSPKDQCAYNRLEKLSGPTFDHAYARNMLANDEHDVAMFGQEAKGGKVPAIQEFASNTLPILEHHLGFARMMNQEVRSGATQGKQNAPTAHSRQNRSQKPAFRN